jgi:tRNA modification GTPase
MGRLPEPRRAALARVRDPASGEMIDEALALWFPGPKSETGEDTAELQLHGGRAVLAAVLAALGRIEGLRPAEAGEFTRRAFANGHLDLTEVEGLADLIGAETEAQRRQAFRQLKGLLGDKAEGWRKRLIEALALIEAGIDFADEDLPDAETLRVKALTTARALRNEIDAVLADARRGERLREGFVVAIAGPPNAGKSTLLNRIARREAAIVSPQAGTTRDVIEVDLDLDGYPVTLLDTAGIRVSDDPVEQEGVRRARERAAAADLVLWVVDARDPIQSGVAYNPRDQEYVKYEDNLETIGSSLGISQNQASRDPAATAAPRSRSATFAPECWLIRNKVDLLSPAEKRNEPKSQNYRNNIESLFATFSKAQAISATAGTGIDSLLEELANTVRSSTGSEPALITRARHRAALEETSSALSRALPGTADDFLAEELRLAARALGRLTGRVDVEDILDVIFRDFCIGK